MADERLPTGLWIEAKLRDLDHKAVSYYVANKGNYFSGTVLLKINGLNGYCQVLTQLRDECGKLKWAAPLKETKMAELNADAYIKRSIDRDGDIWVIEIEDRNFTNPFEAA